jgi:hypothetical protein
MRSRKVTRKGSRKVTRKVTHKLRKMRGGEGGLLGVAGRTVEPPPDMPLGGEDYRPRPPPDHAATVARLQRQSDEIKRRHKELEDFKDATLDMFNEVGCSDTSYTKQSISDKLDTITDITALKTYIDELATACEVKEGEVKEGEVKEGGRRNRSHHRSRRNRSHHRSRRNRSHHRSTKRRRSSRS